MQGFVRVKSLENKSVKKYFAERERARADVGAGATRSGSPERKRVRFKTDAALEAGAYTCPHCCEIRITLSALIDSR